MVLLLACVAPGVAVGQVGSGPPAQDLSEILRSLESRLDGLERENREIRAENARLLEAVKKKSPLEVESLPVPGVTALAPLPDPNGVPVVPPDDSSFLLEKLDHGPVDVSSAFSSGLVQPLSPQSSRNYKAGYDKGFVLTPENLDESPFSLKVNNQNAFRYNGFIRGADFWTDSTGAKLPLSNSSNFQIPRGRLIFSGHAFSPKLSYLLNIDYNTVTSNPIGFRAYSLSYRFNRGFELFLGQSKVPGSREWLTSSFVALEGPDRSMATTFFRPSLSQGIWIMGEPVDGLFYHAMVSNGFNTMNIRPSQLDSRFCWSGSTWWEPWGSFGPGYADIEDHQELVVRTGGSFTFSVDQGSQSGLGAPENNSLRLSDGTLITQLGAFAPGVTLQKYDIGLAAIDLAFKYRGFSISTEGYAQNLSSLQGDGPLPIRSTQAYGGFLQGGYFVVPRKVELYSRSSFVTGHYGTGSEIAGGFNWFPLEGKSNLRLTFDATWLENSPADQNRTGFVAGQTGLLLRTQISTSF